MVLTKNEEDYLKALFRLVVESNEQQAGTNQLAEYLSVSPASVNGMLKKLKKKELVDYEKYGKLGLTKQGESAAVQLIRKHRLWETFLYRHMNFDWEEVHDVAEQLEHIQSDKLINELDRFLGFPKKDPHGEMIPDQDGHLEPKPSITLAMKAAGDHCKLVAVKDGSVAFLRYVSEIGLALSSEILVLDVREFDGSMLIRFDSQEVNVSRMFAENLYVG